MRKVCAFLPVFLLLAASVQGQSLAIDKLDRTTLSQASKEVEFSALLEGTIDDPDLEVFVFVHQPHLNRWRAFPATTDYAAETKGRYRWRAIIQFGELDGKGIGNTYQVKVMAFDKQTASKGLPEKARAETVAASMTEVITLKRVR